jgi:hypothetical protein
MDASARSDLVPLGAAGEKSGFQGFEVHALILIGKPVPRQSKKTVDARNRTVLCFGHTLHFAANRETTDERHRRTDRPG